MILCRIKTRLSMTLVTMVFVMAVFLFSGIAQSFARQEEASENQSGQTIIQSPEESSGLVQDVFAFRSSNIIGSPVQNSDGEQLGNIEDLIVDTQNGQIIFGVLSFGEILGIGGDLFAIPWEKFTPMPLPGAFILDISPEKLEKAPGFPPDE